MVLSNSTGTIDQGFIGEITAVFYHILPNMPRYKVGDKIIQIKLGATESLEFEEVDELTKTERGEGAFGSTGK
jgi:dUTP pyrophosphatase